MPRFALHRLALRIAAGVAAGAFAVLVGAGAFEARVDVVRSGTLALAIGAVGYGVAHAALARRLRLVGAALEGARAHRSDAPAGTAPATDELGALVGEAHRTGRALVAEIRELRRMEHYRRDFLGNVSHELKTPLFAVQGFAETLLDGALDDPAVREAFVEKILRNTERLALLARDLTDLARIESGELPMAPSPFALDRVAREVAEVAEPAAGPRGVALAVHAPDPLPPAWGDRERIRQVLQNLVDNAVKYNRPGGRVDVEVAHAPGAGVEGGRLTVAVRDTGIGLAEADLPRLTERFFRVDKSRSREAGGTGLGLAIVKHVLAAHDARLAVESRLGEGSTFRFELPTAPAPPRAPRPHPAPTGPAAGEPDR